MNDARVDSRDIFDDLKIDHFVATAGWHVVDFNYEEVFAWKAWKAQNIKNYFLKIREK